MAADEKYPVFNRDILMIAIEMQIFEVQKTFSQFLAAFLKARLNSEHFEKKDDPHRFCIFESTSFENVVR